MRGDAIAVLSLLVLTGYVGLQVLVTTSPGAKRSISALLWTIADKGFAARS